VEIILTISSVFVVLNDVFLAGHDVHVQLGLEAVTTLFACDFLHIGYS